MQSKYKSLGTRMLLIPAALLAFATGWFGGDVLRIVAWMAGALLLVLAVRPAYLRRYLPLIALAVAIAMLASGRGSALPWLWIIPLCLQSIPGRCGTIVNIMVYVGTLGYAAITLSPPSALVAGISLSVIWLLCLEYRRSASPISAPETHWLMPASRLDADVQDELRRSEREALHGEVTIFGCAHPTTGQMNEFCQVLHDNLALYERAYHLDGQDIAVLLVATNAEAAYERRQQLEHAISPHRVISSTPLRDVGGRFRSYRSRPQSPQQEAATWS
ncbi:hypothetical protein [Salinicola avicenniae]|uniref:hypothetical protein n=1 Tax=Salinicola avicenniae TaxID=2916836 RepID=UPI002072A6A3|nr:MULTISPECIES: hypothetical protein [unclassified Salinicola]